MVDEESIVLRDYTFERITFRRSCLVLFEHLLIRCIIRSRSTTRINTWPKWVTRIFSITNTLTKCQLLRKINQRSNCIHTGVAAFSLTISRGGTYPSSGEQGASPGTRPPTNGNRHHVSPYLQKLPHSNFLYVKPPPSSAASSARQRKHQRAGHSQQHHRPRRSASASRTRGELLDAAYQPTNLDHLDLSSFFSVSNQSFRRPTSAPTRTYVPISKKVIVHSCVFVMSRNSASRKKKHLKTSHPRSHTRSQGFLLTLYRNGDNEKCCYCKASSLNAVSGHELNEDKSSRVDSSICHRETSSTIGRSTFVRCQRRWNLSSRGHSS